MATLARRYIFKLAANIISIPVYLLMEMILPRALGPVTYGNYNYATTMFQQFTGFLDMGTSTCLYNQLACHHKRPALLSFYFRIIILILILLVLACGLLYNPNIGARLMPQIPYYLVPLAALWAWLTWVGRVLRSANDALGITIPSELFRSIISMAAVMILLVLFLTGTLNAGTLFLQQYFLLGASACAFWSVCHNFWAASGKKTGWSLPRNQKQLFARRFFNYSHPLFVQGLLSFFMIAAERWLLQWFDGSAQQGFFSLSQKVGMACFLFVSAMTPLLMREFSIAWKNNNTEAIGILLSRFAPLLYAIAAYFSCFTVVEAREIVEIFGGNKFRAAILPVQIMALYPVHQAYGQIASSVFHSSGKTRILRNMTAIECVYGLMLAWIMIAPAQLYGFNLGATGLAIKTVITQFISVNIYLWLVSRFVQFNFYKNLSHQIWALCLFILIGILCREISLLWLGSGFLRFLFSGLLYSIILAICGFLFPAIYGFSRQDLLELSRRFIHKNANKNTN